MLLYILQRRLSLKDIEMEAKIQLKISPIDLGQTFTERVECIKTARKYFI
jgi:hypothetical protein